MIVLANKDRKLVAAIRTLERTLGEGSICTVDYWDGDRLAVGVEKPGRPGVLAYIALGSKRRFFVSFELPPLVSSDLPYTPAGEIECDDIRTLCRVVGQFLERAAAPDGTTV